MLRFKENPIQFLLRVSAQEMSIGSNVLTLLLLPSIAMFFLPFEILSILQSSMQMLLTSQSFLIPSHIGFFLIFSHGPLCMHL